MNLGFKTSSSTWQNLGHELRSHKSERRALNRFASKVGRKVARTKPRLVRVDTPALQVFTLDQFLSSQPIVVSELVELATPQVASFDRRAEVAAQL